MIWCRLDKTLNQSFKYDKIILTLVDRTVPMSLRGVLCLLRSSQLTNGFVPLRLRLMAATKQSLFPVLSDLTGDSVLCQGAQDWKRKSQEEIEELRDNEVKQTALRDCSARAHHDRKARTLIYQSQIIS